MTDETTERVRETLPSWMYEVSRPAYLGVDYACVVTPLDGPVTGTLDGAAHRLRLAGFAIERDDDRLRVFKEGR